MPDRTKKSGRVFFCFLRSCFFRSGFLIKTKRAHIAPYDTHS